MKLVYTVAESVKPIFIYGAGHKCASTTVRVFKDRHKYTIKLIKKFQETGSVQNKKREGARMVDKMVRNEVLGIFTVNLTNSLLDVVINCKFRLFQT